MKRGGGFGGGGGGYNEVDDGGVCGAGELCKGVAFSTGAQGSIGGWRLLTLRTLSETQLRRLSAMLSWGVMKLLNEWWRRLEQRERAFEFAQFNSRVFF